MPVHVALPRPCRGDGGRTNGQVTSMTQGFEFGAMFTLGILGTGHCIGMCGPLVVALPGRVGRLSAHLSYHAGRIATYSLVGGMMGGMGTLVSGVAAAAGADPLTWMSGVQAAFSIASTSFVWSAEAKCSMSRRRVCSALSRRMRRSINSSVTSVPLIC